MSQVPPDSKLEALRELIAEKIRDEPWSPAAEQVLTHKTGDLYSRVDEIVGRSAGLVVVVAIGKAAEVQAQTGRISWDAEIEIDVIENRTMHQSAAGDDAPGAWSYAEALAALFKNAEIGPQLLVTLGKEPIRELAPERDSEDLVVRLTVICRRLTGNNRDIL